MKHFFAILILQTISVAGICQVSKKPADNREKPEQFLWSYSKNKAAAIEKPLIDFDAINNWRTLGDYLAVNNDGSYFAYTINKRGTGTGYLSTRLDSLVLQSTTRSWRMAFVESKEGFFTGDGKQYIFQKGGDLCLLQIGSGLYHSVKNIYSYKASEKKDWLAWKVKDNDSLILRNLATGKECSFGGVADYNFNHGGEWLACVMNYKNKKPGENELLLYNLATGGVYSFPFVVNYAFANSGSAMLLKSIVKTDIGTSTVLIYLDSPDGNEKFIWSTNKEKITIASYSFDNSGKQVVFSIVDSTDANRTGIWYYETGMEKAVLKLNNGTREVPEGLTINNGASFTDNGKYIQFSLHAKPAATGKPTEDMAGVEVWNYKDVYLQSKQFKQLNDVASNKAIINIGSGKVIFLENSHKKLGLLKGDFALVKKDYKEMQGDRFWESETYKDSMWIVSLKDGSSYLLPTKAKRGFWFSPDGNWVIYFDADKGCHYFCYNLHTGELKNISATVANNQLGITGGSDEGNDQISTYSNLAAWIENEESVLVYDSYDIWKLDLTGKQPAVNITNGFGQSTKIVLNLFITDHYSSTIPIIKTSESLILRAFNRKTKQNGFYKKANLNAGTPTELYMGSYFMNAIPGCHDPNLSNDGMAPMKAKNSEVWIVQRQSASDAPNYYRTNDFKNFRRLTNLQAQARYRWFTQELHSFIHLDGSSGQGILYKPEGFDPEKKYPVLIAFYGGFSNNMYQFCEPAYMDQAMEAGKSPIWFLNNDFLVFTPDIAVAPLKYGPKAFSCIEGAAKYLQQLPYIDGNKLAFASHSWSAQLGAYLSTHSTTFKAAAISEGYFLGNVISNAFSITEGENYLRTAEVGKNFGNLWENKASWLDETTVLNADKSRTPLLLLSNKGSAEDHRDQVVQLFMALRRLNKMAWWLKYDNGDHTLYEVKERKDYTIRYTQFFDHYLKNAPAPLWMTQGIPYKLKGIESRYELDPQGTCNAPNGEPCPICQAWNAQYKKTPVMFQKEIKDWVLDKDIAAELERKQNEKRKQLDKQGEIQTKEVMRMLEKK